MPPAPLSIEWNLLDKNSLSCVLCALQLSYQTSNKLVTGPLLVTGGFCPINLRGDLELPSF